MNKKEVDLFEKVNGQMEALHAEIAILAKKSPNDAVNKFKLKFVNKVLGEANNLLKGTYKPFAEFAFFEEDDLPSNSDVTLILAQYLNCLDKLRSDNIKRWYGYWVWVIRGHPSQIRTAPPKKLKAK